MSKRNNDFVLWPYPYYYGIIVGYFRTTIDEEVACAYLRTQKIKIGSKNHNITYPTDFQLIKHNGVLILICNYGIAEDGYTDTSQYKMTMDFVLDKYTTQINKPDSLFMCELTYT